jgi:putrescine---pyruvate transaminase
MAEVSAHGELVLARGEGAYVEDESGHRYLDAAGGLWFCNVGHGRRELAHAAARQMATLASYSSFGDLANRPALNLADRIASMVPVSDARVFFTSGGSDSVDTAVKLARRYWARVGHPQRDVIVTREHAYHGMHMAGTSLSGIAANRADHGSLDPAVIQVAWDDAEALDRLLGVRDDIAAFFCEPVIGAGGVYAPPPGYLQRVRDICRRHDVLFVADEVICGFGRTGEMFASGRWGIDPDVLLAAKGITSGYMPLGAVIVGDHVAEPFWSRGNEGHMWRHGYTYSAHATACAVAMANLDVLDAEDLVSHVSRLQHVLKDSLLPLAAYDLVSEVRAGVGLLGAVDFTAEAKAAGVPSRVIAGLREREVLTRTLASGAIQISPPFVVVDDDITHLAQALGASIESAGGTRQRPPSSGLIPQLASDGGVDAYDDGHYLAERPPHHG